MTLRIIGGLYRRRHLKTPHGMTTRPYTDRVRQIVFDRIIHLLEDARVADIFSGVGTMGLEAISRGAGSCVFIEGDPKVHEALKENVSLLIEDQPTVCWKTNIHRTSFCPNGADEIIPYDLVFFDPPYDQCPLLDPAEALGKTLVRLAKPRVTAENAVVVLRTPRRFDLPECAAWRVDDMWPISSMKIWILKKPGTEKMALDDAVDPEAESQAEAD